MVGCLIKKSVLLLIAWILILSTLTSCFEDGVLYTEDIKDYKSDKYPIPSIVFASDLPSNATVVTFSNYNYWNEVFDIYLELKFNSVEELDEYVSIIVNNALKLLRNSNQQEPVNGWILEDNNPYNNSYIDLVFLQAVTSNSYKSWVGYEIETTDESTIISSNFTTISYSYKDLTVVQSYMRGAYALTKNNNYIFKYFTKFNISTSKSHERIIDVIY